MKFKKVLASILAAGLTMTCFTACDLDEDYDYEGDLWEYKTLTSLDIKTLTSLGKQGWEMCGIEPTTTYPINCGPECGPIHGSKYYFKRRIDDEEV